MALLAQEKIMRNLILFQKFLTHDEPSQDLIFDDLIQDRETSHYYGLMGVIHGTAYLG